MSEIKTGDRCRKAIAEWEQMLAYRDPEQTRAMVEDSRQCRVEKYDPELLARHESVRLERHIQ